MWLDRNLNSSAKWRCAVRCAYSANHWRRTMGWRPALDAAHSWVVVENRSAGDSYGPRWWPCARLQCVWSQLSFLRRSWIWSLVEYAYMWKSALDSAKVSWMRSTLSMSRTGLRQCWVRSFLWDILIFCCCSSVPSCVSSFPSKHHDVMCSCPQCCLTPSRQKLYLWDQQTNNTDVIQDLRPHTPLCHVYTTFSGLAFLSEHLIASGSRFSFLSLTLALALCLASKKVKQQ